MKLTRATAFCISVFTALCACCQTHDETRNRIVFINDVSEVYDSLHQMEKVIKFLPPHDLKGWFIDNEDSIFINTESVFGLQDISSHESIKPEHPLLKNMTEETFQRFVTLIVFLKKNQIYGSHIDNMSGLMFHEYRRTKENLYNDVRKIMIDVDTTSNTFVQHFQILDSYQHVVLCAPLDADIN